MSALKTSIQRSLYRWIQKICGLHITPVNEAPVLLALKVLSSQQHLSAEEYALALINEQISNHDFLDQITTHESYFLRHQPHMIAAIEEVIQPLLNQGIRPRVLSAPCAQGEEPFSFAMLLQDYGIHPSRVEIVGVDISQNSIERAKRAQFRSYSLRNTPRSFLQRHFFKSGAFYQINPTIHNAVQFQNLNLLTEATTRLIPGFHLIFSHNMLIYFDPETCTRMVEIFKQLLSDDGWFFVDTVEASKPGKVLVRGQLKQQAAFHKQRPPKSAAETVQSPKPIHRNPLQPVTATVSSAASPDAAEIRNKRHAAQQAYEKKEFSKSLDLYNQIIGQHPIWASWARIGKAKILIDTGQDMEALEEAEKAIENKGINPSIYLPQVDEADAHATIALVLHRKGMGERSNRHLTQVRRLNPRHEILQLLK